MTPFYLTTAIAYPNAKPHMGHALEFIGSDMIARYYRLKGRDVFFSTGTDEHGQKIYEAASAEGKTAKELATYYSDSFQAFMDNIHISYDKFIRTSDEEHYAFAQDIWRRCEENGDIYKKEYKALYCVGCEAFKTKSNLDEDGKCPDHPSRELQEVEEENYFFALSKYSDAILEHYEKHPEFVQPDFRRKEIANVVKDGLEDISISRQKTKLPWGIPVPGDEDQVMYVWYDALTNYLSSVGGHESKYWPASVHVIGKDIIRHHAALWPAMLMSAGIELPKQVMAHGFVTAGGKKMSKSEGKPMDPAASAARLGADALRLCLVESVDFYDDGDFTDELLDERYNALLANGVGNLVSRSIAMATKFAENTTVAVTADDGFAGLTQEIWNDYDQAMAAMLPGKAIKSLFRLVDYANGYVEETKPWVLAKDEAQAGRLKEVIANLLETNRQLALLLKAIIPHTADKIAGFMGLEVFAETMSQEDFEQAQKWGQLAEGIELQKPEILFPRPE